MSLLFNRTPTYAKLSILYDVDEPIVRNLNVAGSVTRFLYNFSSKYLGDCLTYQFHWLLLLLLTLICILFIVLRMIGVLFVALSFQQKKVSLFTMTMSWNIMWHLGFMLFSTSLYRARSSELLIHPSRPQLFHNHQCVIFKHVLVNNPSSKVTVPVFAVMLICLSYFYYYLLSF